MQKLASFLLLFIIYGSIIAQKIPQIEMPSIDNEALKTKELERRKRQLVPTFAENIAVQLSPSTHGNWSVEGDYALWQLSIYSPNAHSLNLGFTTFKMPQKGKLWLMNKDSSQQLGPFTAVDNETYEEFWSPIIKGDKVILKLFVPAAAKETVKLTIGYVNHDFMGFGASLSQGCHLDVICGIEDGFPEVDSIREAIQSVAVYSLNGSRLCTGFLINNTRQDCTPYFMTARHCGINVVNAASVVTYWKYENSKCRNINTAENRLQGDGKLEVTNSGARFLMESAEADITLIELDDPVAEAADAVFSGWNIDLAELSSTFCVHHPNGEEKRISFAKTPSFIGDLDPSEYLGLIRNPIIVPSWDIGSTESGSSGAPLFDRNKLALGVINGGLASCENQEFDAFGPIATAWKNDSDPSAQLSSWLDPDGFGLQQLDGLSGRSCSNTLVPNTYTQLVCENERASYQIELSEALLDSVQFSQIGLPSTLEIIVTQEQNIVTIDLANVSALKDSSIVWKFVAKNNVQTASVLLKLGVLSNNVFPPTLFSPQKEAKDINTFPFFTWSEGVESSRYQFQLTTDSTFNSVLIDTTDLSTANIHNLELASNTTYYWRVRSSTKCSQSEWSAVTQFQTATCANFIAKDVPVTISDGAPNSYQSNLVIDTAGSMVDVDVINLTGKHSWISDLQFSLESPAGTTVQLLDRPCLDERDFNLNLNDEALLKTIPCPLTDGKTYQPVSPLSAFQGESVTGNWTLKIRDNESVDGGMLENWGLRVCYTNKTTAINNVSTSPVTLYPNPTNGKLFIKADPSLQLKRIQVFDMQGRLVATPNLINNAFDVEGLINGVYIVEITSKHRIWIDRIIIQ